MSESSNWCTIESDPGVFTSLIESFGVVNAQLTELWSLDDDSLTNIVNSHGSVYGLIFLFKWQSQQEPTALTDSEDRMNIRQPLVGDDAPPDLFFAKQVTTNACATQAILSVLLNTDTSTDDVEGKLELGTTLSSLKSFAAPLPPDLKGESIGTCEEIRTAHNSFARRETFLFDNSKQRMATENDDVFHFIAFVPHTDGIVYELDGLQVGPIPISSSDSDKSVCCPDGGLSDLSWLAMARTAIQDRIDKYAATEIKFNLMALVKDKRVHIKSKIRKMEVSGVAQDDPSMQQLQVELIAEEEQRQQWKDENERRRHNYLPFCIELIRALAGAGKL